MGREIGGLGEGEWGGAQQISELGCKYGDLPVHTSLGDSCEETKDDILSR